MRTSYSYTVAVMGGSHDWLYEGFKKGGCHTSEWFEKNSEVSRPCNYFVTNR
jgi:hypothetical protein